MVRERRPPQRGREGGRPSRAGEIVAKAAALFATRGYHNTSLADIASELDMTPAGILHHFQVKENLLTAVLQARDEGRISPPRRRTSETGAAFLDHLRRTVAANERRVAITQLYAVLSAESVTEGHPAQPWFRYRYVGLRQDVDHAIRAQLGFPDGFLTADTRAAATVIIAAMDGLQVQWLLDPDELSMTGSLDLAIEGALGALRERAAALVNP